MCLRLAKRNNDAILIQDPAMREYWGSQFALDKYTGTNADTYIWPDWNVISKVDVSSCHKLSSRRRRSLSEYVCFYLYSLALGILGFFFEQLHSPT